MKVCGATYGFYKVPTLENNIELKHINTIAVIIYVQLVYDYLYRSDADL